MTAHELAKKLLEGPDWKVEIRGDDSSPEPFVTLEPDDVWEEPERLDGPVINIIKY